MHVASRILVISAAVSTVAIAVPLVARLSAIWPLYVSRDVRGQAKAVMTSLQDDLGIAISFFTVDSLRCTAVSLCHMVLKEQWNSVTAHAPLQ